MNKRNLPVKIFSKRVNVDERAVEGMGSNELPSWCLSEKQLKKRADEFTYVLQKGKELFKKRDARRIFIPVTMIAVMNEDAVAKSHRRKITQLFNTRNEDNIIGMINDNTLIVKIDNERDINIIEEQINKYEKNAYSLSAVEELDIFKPDINILRELGNPIKVKLLNYNNYELDAAVAQLFESICHEENIKFTKRNYTDEMTIYKIITDNVLKLETIKSFEGILSMEDMPSYSSIDIDFYRDEIGDVEVKKPEENKNYPIVGVLDTGVCKNKYLENWVIDKTYSSYPKECMNKQHGTFVSGIIAYGDELEKKNYTGNDGCKIFDATVFCEGETIDQDELLNNIENVLKRHCDNIKIWNLSIGSQEEADLDSFSDFGMALDALQDKYDVLICKSAGNTIDFIHGKPKARISKSADSVRALVVGSIAQKQEKYDISPKNYPSPFSRIGRGPAYIIKPDLVHYGGNAGVDSSGKLNITGVKSLSENGRVIKNIGTSFSTPRVSAILAGVYNQLNEEFDPLLLKGLVIHAAKYPSELDMPINEKVNQVGFGLPPSVPEIIYNTPNEITLIMRDRISRGEYIEILDFPYPKTLAHDGTYYGQITVTVINNPILDSQQAAEYCQSDIKVSLGTYDNKLERDITKPYIKNPIGKGNAKNVLQQSCYSKKRLSDNSCEFGTRERLLIQYGDKYYPIKKYSVDLDEMTQGNKTKYLNANKKWYLKVEGLYRDSAERKAIKYGNDLYQDLCILITIKDSRNENNPIYNEVTSLLDYYNFYHNNINIRQNINVNVEINQENEAIEEFDLDEIFRKYIKE